MYLPLISTFSFSFTGELWSSMESFRSAYTTLSPVMQQPCPAQARPILHLSNLSLERRSLRFAIRTSTIAAQKCFTYLQRVNIHRRSVLSECPLPPTCPPQTFQRPPVRCCARHRLLLWPESRIFICQKLAIVLDLLLLELLRQPSSSLTKSFAGFGAGSSPFRWPLRCPKRFLA